LVVGKLFQEKTSRTMQYAHHTENRLGQLSLRFEGRENGEP
jgi:hypothetical protein